MRCRQLLSLSLTLATLLVLVKCETAVNTSIVEAKASGDPQNSDGTINHQPAAVNISATTNGTGLPTNSPPVTDEPITNTTVPQTPNWTNATTPAPKVDGNTTATKGDGNTTATIGNGTTTATKGNETTTEPKGNATTIKPPVTTTPKPHNSANSALTALSAVTLCVLSLTVSL